MTECTLLIGQYDVNDNGTRALPHSHVSSFKTVLKRNEMFTPQEVLEHFF